ncbi:MAG TPA: TonB-dependent receptor [Bacteroidales bacterium]|nr:TonB-dependent receptor [Bacteroidales bacterium]
MCIIKVKRLTIGLLLFCFLTPFLLAQRSAVSLSFNNTELINVLDKIEQETGYYFLFNEKLIDTKKLITINVIDKDVNSVLQQLFSDSDIKYSIINDKIILTPGFLLSKVNPLIISGTTVDETGNWMAGVNIHIDGSSIGTTSDSKGRFEISAKDRNDVLIFSFIGYEQQHKLVGDNKVMNIKMEPMVSDLEEVIVIGYGTLKKTDLTGAVVAVREESYKSQPVSRVDDILQGRSAGVIVTNISGAPGGTTSIRIRGSNSITGSNEPLYVIDGFVGGNMADVNPTDIGSIQILKDASSTAVYGSRGANGVVLITTKRGPKGNPQLSLTSRYFISDPIKLWPLLKASEFTQVCNEKADVLGFRRPFTDQQVQEFEFNEGTDWQDLIYRKAIGEEIQLDYSGDNDLINFFISGNYLNQNGIIINSFFKRYALRTNLEAKLTKALTGSLKISFTRRESNNTDGNYTTSGVVAASTAWAPTTPAYDQNGVLTKWDPVCSIKTNPVELATNDNINVSNSFVTNGNFKYTIIPDLSFETGIGVSYNASKNKSFTQRLLTNTPSASRANSEMIFMQNTNMLTYTKALNEFNTLKLTGVAEYQFQQDERFYAFSNNLLFPFLEYENMNLAKTYSLINRTMKSTIGSYIARLNYSLFDRYLITASIRSDRSSKFRGSNQTSVFPSIAGGWRLSEEKFMQKFDFISNLKIRASWGKTGSQAIDVYGTVTYYNTSVNEASVSWQNGTITPGINLGNPGNENLKWENTTQTNIGFDLGVLKERLTFEFDYFYKKTTDLLLNEPLPGYVGGGSIFRNIGSLQNLGYELTVNSLLLSRRDISWNVNFNISVLRNEVLDLGDRPYILQAGGAGSGMLTAPEMILKPGFGISTYYGFRSLGIWQVNDAELAALYGQQPGDYRYEDVNGDYAFTGEDFQIIGSGIPKKVLGLNSTITFRNFTLNAFLQSFLDYDKWNFAYAQIMIAAADAREYTHRDILNRWSPENPSSRVAAFSKTNVPRIQSSEYVESGNYLRLKNVSLQYTFRDSFIKGALLSASISAQNLFTLTKYKGLDPETYSNVGLGDLRGGDGGAYPNARTWTLGITLGFK